MDRDYFSKVIDSIIVNKIDTLYYSHWEDGQYLKSFSKVQLDDNKNIFSFIKDGSNYNYVEHFTISLPSILKKVFLLKFVLLKKNLIGLLILLFLSKKIPYIRNFCL